MTAVLVSIAPPGPATTELAAPPLPVGPVVPAGTLAGPITVIATASAGQLVVRMSAPGRDDLGSDNATPDQPGTAPPNYQLGAQLTPTGAPPQSVALRGCGAGCFTSPVTWTSGTTALRLTITAAPFPTSTATLDIPWPPRTDDTLLPKVLAAMKVAQFTVHQAVTSNYNGNPGFEAALPFRGPDFLATEPYGSGGGTPVILAARPGETEIGLAYPQGIAIHLFIGADNRILREEAATPNHLITSTFEYPPSAGP